MSLSVFVFICACWVLRIFSIHLQPPGKTSAHRGPLPQPTMDLFLPLSPPWTSSSPSAHHGPLPPSQPHLIQFLDDGRGLFGRGGVALQQLLEQRLRVGVGAEEGLLQDVQVHALVLGQCGDVTQAKVYEHQAELCLPVAAPPQQHVGGGEVPVHHVLVVHPGQDPAHSGGQRLQGHQGGTGMGPLPSRRDVVTHCHRIHNVLQEDAVGGVVHKVHHRGGDAWEEESWIIMLRQECVPIKLFLKKCTRKFNNMGNIVALFVFLFRKIPL